MHLSRRKIIIALLPFVITTIAISIFLLFFYWGTISFHGISPFSVVYNGEQYSDHDGIVTIHAHAGTQEFLLTKANYENKTVVTDVSWSHPTEVGIAFIYEAKVSALVPFTPGISYVNPIAISDNQLEDIVIASNPRKLTLPSGINRVIWDRSANQACLLHTGSGNVQNQLLTAHNDTFVAELLDNNIFDCQAADSGVHQISIQNNTLHIDSHSLAIPQSQEWTVTSSLYLNEVFITAKAHDTAKQTLIYWDLHSDKTIPLGEWAMTGPIRIIGPQSVAIPTVAGIVISHAKSTDFTLANTVNINSIVLDADATGNTGDTVYYIDTDHEQSLKNIFQATTVTHFIYQQHYGEEKAKILYAINDDQTLLSARLSPDLSEAWYLFDKPTSSLLKISIAPKK